MRAAARPPERAEWAELDLVEQVALAAPEGMRVALAVAQTPVAMRQAM